MGIDRRSISSPVNGQRGGVKTEEGKAISSMNSLKHGILSNYATNLDDQTFDEVYAAYASEFDDNTPSRQTLIAKLAILHIRMRRATRFESEFIRDRMGLKDFSLPFTQSTDPMSLDLCHINSLDNIYTKYEPVFLAQYLKIIEVLNKSKK